jgi:hypothetical protein
MGCYLILIFFKEPEQKLFFYFGVLEELKLMILSKLKEPHNTAYCHLGMLTLMIKFTWAIPWVRLRVGRS